MNSGSLTATGGTWNAAGTVYTATYTVVDANVTLTDVTVDVTGAQDAAGNLQQDYTAQIEFSIDTENPTVTDVTVSDLLITDAEVLSVDIEPGMALKSLSRFADVIAVTTNRSQKFFKKKVFESGYPLRADLARWDRLTAHQHLGIFGGFPILLVFGGSKGARSINLTVLEHLRELLAKFEIIHISGEREWPLVKHHREQLPMELAARYHALPYCMKWEPRWRLRTWWFRGRVRLH